MTISKTTQFAVVFNAIMLGMNIVYLIEALT